jgi:protein-S-isoprenylcysteine O-methyltransferase Ste14
VSLRALVHGTLLVLFGRQLWVAGSTFRIVPGEMPKPQRIAIPLSIAAVWGIAQSASPRLWFVVPGVTVAGCSLGLLEWARASIRRRYFSYLFSRDVPQFLHAVGPYAYVRHPFYASYLLAYVATAILMPGAPTLAILAGMFVFYRAAAVTEERKFAASPLASEYDAYKRRTGRFVPKI